MKIFQNNTQTNLNIDFYFEYSFTIENIIKANYENLNDKKQVQLFIKKLLIYYYLELKFIKANFFFIFL
jgi:hypothetical protein